MGGGGGESAWGFHWSEGQRGGQTEIVALVGEPSGVLPSRERWGIEKSGKGHWKGECKGCESVSICGLFSLYWPFLSFLGPFDLCWSFLVIWPLFVPFGLYWLIFGFLRPIGPRLGLLRLVGLLGLASLDDPFWPIGPDDQFAQPAHFFCLFLSGRLHYLGLFRSVVPFCLFVALLA